MNEMKFAIFYHHWRTCFLYKGLLPQKSILAKNLFAHGFKGRMEESGKETKSAYVS